MIDIWPERTDPAKFVYEDVAIASYLLMIWQQEREEKGGTKLQSFVDLGCGNGLLVYILSMEGHKGFGIDLRKRQIWDIYPKEVDLRVEAIVPSDENLYPDIDWVIGNHSDELSPWVPVIAARSSFTCRYFVLPCCAYDFNGKKFQRGNSNISQYEAFMEYVRKVSDVCGYETKVDRLKIPSTKRICLIGYDRSEREVVKNGSTSFRQLNGDITEFIASRTISADAENVLAEGGGHNLWSGQFKPRESVEAVKNCTKVNKSVVSEIVALVFQQILSTEHFDDNLFAGKWNRGKGVPITELAKLLPRDKLGELKSECGGLQTLLRNHHQIFEVRGGEVKLRIPVTIEEKKKQLQEGQRDRKGNQRKNQGPVREMHFQLKPCFFFNNHPGGCPLGDDVCTFKHIKE